MTGTNEALEVHPLTGAMGAEITGVDLSAPLDNATVLIVEYADLHDMVRLHRLRGHISRGPRSGTGLYILSDNPEEKSRSLIEQVLVLECGLVFAHFSSQENAYFARSCPVCRTHLAYAR